MLAGVAPFEGKNARALMAAHATKPPEPIARRRPGPPDAARRFSDAIARQAPHRPASLRGRSAATVGGRGAVRTAPSRFLARLSHELRGRWILMGFSALAVMALALALLVHDLRTPASAERPTVSQIVPPPGTHVGQSWDLSLSNDGTRLAMAATATGSPASLWIQRLDTIGLTRVEGTEGASMPFWSGDGQSIRFDN